jgi:hypothetical protein
VRRHPPPVEEKFDGELPLMSTSVAALGALGDRPLLTPAGY